MGNSRSPLNPKTQIKQQGVYNDQVTIDGVRNNFERLPGEVNPTGPNTIADDVDNMLSVIRRIITSGAGNWYDNLVSDNGGTEYGLNEIVNKRVIRRLGFSSTDITVAATSNSWSGAILPNKSLAIDGEATTDNVDTFVTAVTDATLANEFALDSDGNIENLVTLIDKDTGEPVETGSGQMVVCALTALTGQADSSAVTLKFFTEDTSSTKTRHDLTPGTYKVALPYQDTLITAPRSMFIQPGGAAGMEMRDIFSQQVEIRKIAGAGLTSGQVVTVDGSGEVIAYDATTESNSGKVVGVLESNVSAGDTAKVIICGMMEITVTGTPGDIVYSSLNVGTLTSTRPTADLVAPVGIIVDATHILIIPINKNDSTHIMDNIIEVDLPMAFNAGTTLKLVNGAAIDEFSTDPTMAANSSTIACVQSAIVGFVGTLRSDWNKSGFVDITDSTIAFTDGDLTLSIQPVATSFDYFVLGTRYTSTGDAVAIDNTEGIHLVYYDGATLTALANPTETETSIAIRIKALVAIIYWDVSEATAIYVGEERHGKNMDGETHGYLHFTQGLAYRSGLALNTINADGAGATADAQFGVDEGYVLDEDLYLAISAVASTTGLPIYYMTGAKTWNKYTEAGFSMRTFDGTNATLLAWNQDVVGTWQLTQASESDYVLCHIFATTEKDNPVLAIMGQAVYTNRNKARTGAETEIHDLILDDVLFPEIRPIGTVIFQTKIGYASAINARIVTTDDGDDYIDWRSTTVSRIGLTTSEHNVLSGKQGGTTDEYYHLTSAEYTALSAIESTDSQALTGGTESTGIGSTASAKGTAVVWLWTQENASETHTADIERDIQARIIKNTDDTGINVVTNEDLGYLAFAETNVNGVVTDTTAVTLHDGGPFLKGDVIRFHDSDVGEQFRTITNVSGDNLTLDSNITLEDLANASRVILILVSGYYKNWQFGLECASNTTVYAKWSE